MGCGPRIKAWRPAPGMPYLLIMTDAKNTATRATAARPGDANPSGPAPETEAGAAAPDASGKTSPALSGPEQKSGEIGGPPGPEPTRYGDWELKGRCTDF